EMTRTKPTNRHEMCLVFFRAISIRVISWIMFWLRFGCRPPARSLYSVAPWRYFVDRALCLGGILGFSHNLGEDVRLRSDDKDSQFVLLLLFVSLQVGNAFFHPFGCRRSL